MRLDVGGSAWSAAATDSRLQSVIADRITLLGMLSGGLKWGAFSASELFCMSSF